MKRYSHSQLWKMAAKKPHNSIPKFIFYLVFRINLYWSTAVLLFAVQQSESALHIHISNLF